jgi:hypothetical protein
MMKGKGLGRNRSCGIFSYYSLLTFAWRERENTELHDSRPLEWKSNPRPSEYEVGVLFCCYYTNIMYTWLSSYKVLGEIFIYLLGVTEFLILEDTDFCKLVSGNCKIHILGNYSNKSKCYSRRNEWQVKFREWLLIFSPEYFVFGFLLWKLKN